MCDARRIVSAAAIVDERDEWSGDLLRFIAVAAGTSARSSQLARCRVVDLQLSDRRLMAPVSFKGRDEKEKTHNAVPLGADIIELLKPVIAGRKGHEPLLLRPQRRMVRIGKYVSIGREPWKEAAELTRPWADIIAEAGLPAEIAPYSLRHSSIVRGLRAGLPTRVVAALHDTSVAMIERHYLEYITDALDELARQAIVPLIKYHDHAAGPEPLAASAKVRRGLAGIGAAPDS